MKLHFKIASAIFSACLLATMPAYAANTSADVAISKDMQQPPVASSDVRPPKQGSIPNLTGPIIRNVTVTGNSQVVTPHILSVVTSKAGEHVDEEKLRKDAEAIYELGFFAAADYKVTDVKDGVDVNFVVQENPVVESIKFTGNTVYTSQQLTDLIFTKPGMIFNRTFFRNDLQRIKEKYQADGYAMANVADVKIDGATINVVIVEPKISQIVIQGNKITKKNIIERYLKIKEGDLFNSNKLRLTLNRLQGLGFFEDVNVNFEQGEKSDQVVVILTFQEGRTGRVGFDIAYGTQSGFSGGISYENFNIGGKGLKLSTGFQLGGREQIWVTLEQPYMSGKVMAWRFGAYKRAWDDLYYYTENSNRYLFQYDRVKYGAFAGLGKKFSDDSKYNWYLLLDWHKVNNETDETGYYAKQNWGKRIINTRNNETILDDLGDGNYYSATASIRRFNIDEYLPYTKGDTETIYLQGGKATIEDKDYSYLKYWFEGRVYFPIDKLLGNVLESTFGINTDKPPILAARLMIGSASGSVPYDEMFIIGGDTTLRGYDDEYFHGEQMLLGNFELRVPVQKSLSLVAFYDIGRAWRKDGDVSFGSDIGKAPGVGIRLNTPLGNIRLDYANGEESRFHFGFGEMF